MSRRAIQKDRSQWSLFSRRPSTNPLFTLPVLHWSAGHDNNRFLYCSENKNTTQTTDQYYETKMHGREARSNVLPFSFDFKKGNFLWRNQKGSYFGVKTDRKKTTEDESEVEDKQTARKVDALDSGGNCK